MIQNKLRNTIRVIADFPKKGISYKDLTPVYKDFQLCEEVVMTFVDHFKNQQVDIVIGVESRGFIFAPGLAIMLKAAFVPVRKPGKLPYKTYKQEYNLEYGTDSLELHMDAIKPGDKVLVHDDVLATGGTAEAVMKLVEKAGGIIIGYTFAIELAALKGRDRLRNVPVLSLITYN